MRKLIYLVVLALMAAPVAALAEGSPADQSAAKACTALRASMGVHAFRAYYGLNGGKANAFGKCVAKQKAARAANLTSAGKACKAEMANAAFATAHAGQTFAQMYGANENDKNAYGRCVSSRANAAGQAQVAATIKAAKACKAERSGTAAAFASMYGSGANALGKCIAAKSKA